MRIGFDITALYIAQGGIFYYDYNLIRALLEQGREHDYILLDYHPIHGRRETPPEIRHLLAPNARIVHCRGLRHYRLSRWPPMRHPRLRPIARSIDRLLSPPWTAVTEAVMRRKLTPILEGVDLFHSSDVLQWKQPGATSVVTIYDLTVLLFPEYHTADTRELQWRKYRFAQEEADIIIAISEATKRDIETHLGIPAGRVRVVYGGVDPAFHPIEARQAVAQRLKPLGLTPGHYILHVGTLEPRKNLVRLVEAYHRLRQKRTAPTPPLALAGVKGWMYREIYARVEALHLERAVHFLGWVDEATLPALYNGASLFVYPSLYEGFGLPVLEAMACGVPVVTSNAASLPEVVGDAGLTVEPEDTVGLAEAIAQLLDDPDLRAEMRRRGLARARQFSWKRAAQRLLTIYNEATLTDKRR